MTIIHISKAKDYTVAKTTTQGLVVVDFSATWCGPCKKIEPEIKKMAEFYNEYVTFLHVDVDEPDMIDEEDLQDIRGVPTFKFFKNAKLIDQMSGADKNKLKTMIDQHCGVTIRE